jgi:PAS domain S-box-containing protein
MFANSRLFNYWSRLSLSYRGATIVTIPALCLLATLGTWFWSRAEGLEIRTKIDRSQERIASTKELLIVMLNAETGVRGYLVSGDRNFLEPYKMAQKSLPTALTNLEQSIGIDSGKLTQLNSIRLRIQSIQQRLAELQTLSSAQTRSPLSIQDKQEMDTLCREINAVQIAEQASLDRQRTQLAELQSVIQSLQQLFTVAGILSTIGGICLFQLLERELQQREAQIQTRDSLIQTLTTDIIDGIAILDRSGQIETVNLALIDMCGYTAVDLLKFPLMRLFIHPTTPPSQPLPALVAWLEQQPKLGRIWQIAAYRRDGTHFPIELSVSEIPQQNQWIAIVRDVSAQANLMQQLHTNVNALEQLNLSLLRTNFTLESRNQELAEFAYATAHDLKTPLRGIVTLSEWIEEESKSYSSGQFQHYVQLLRQRIYRLNDLIDGLWEYSNLGQTTVTPEPVDLAILLGEIHAALILPPNFEIEFQPTDIHLTTCKIHLRKVIEELLENAIKHHDRHRGKISIAVQLDGKMLEFSISDDGAGIATQFHQRVFRLFETLHPRDVQENTGIGLAIAKKLVERVGGKIWLANPESGRGLLVHFTWPQHPTG